MILQDNYLRLQRGGVGSLVLGLWGLLGISAPVLAQGAKPQRALEPSFRPGQFSGIFFPNPADQLTGEPPGIETSPPPSPAVENTTSAVAAAARNQVSDKAFLEWKAMISPTSLEDLIKESKSRLDRIVTTPSAFKGGGFVDARVEFSLQALLFAVIESYPGEVRWKSSATLARQRFSRVAANTKVGSDQVFAEAKARLLDLGDLIGGSQLAPGNEGSAEEVDWSQLIDRVPLMQLLEWAYEENLSKLVASENTFREQSDAVLRFAELIAVLGKVALAEEMPDANDEDYKALALAMVEHSGQVVLAVKTSSAEQARAAAAQIGQSCTNCHDNFR